MLVEPSPAATSGALHAQERGGLAARPTAARPSTPSPWPEQLGSINAAAQELGTTWPSLRKAFTRHGLGMPARNPEAVRQRAIAAARQRTGRPATPSLDPVFVALNHGELPIRARSGGELAERVRRAEDYAVLGAEVVVELHSESHAARPSIRAWAITRSAQRAHRLGNATAGATYPALLGGYETTRGPGRPFRYAACKPWP
jgi:hypothetical protein